MKVRKIILGITSLLMMFNTMMSSMSFISSAETYKVGDVNNDGTLSKMDLLNLKQYMLKIRLEVPNGDVNNDGIIDISDICVLKNILIKELNSVEISAPTFSMESGFYDEEFTLSITSNITNAKLYYTTDGSIPTKKSNLYTGAIEVINRSNDDNYYSAISGVSPPEQEFMPTVKVPKGTVIKAIAVTPEGICSDVVTKSYFVGLEDYKNSTIISLSIEEENLFDYNTGIYTLGKVYDDWKLSGEVTNSWERPANYTQRGREWEKPIYFELIEPDGSLGIAQDLGVRITGNATRSYTQKSLKFYARSEYGSKNVKYNLIPGLTKEVDNITPLNKFDTFVLRNGGNDADYSKFRDPLIQDLASDRNVDTLGSRNPVVVFLNGEYWGIYSLQEDYNDKYIENNYNINKDDVIIVKNGDIEEGTQEDLSSYYNMLYFANNNDLSIQENYETICNMLDIDSFIDFCSVGIYINNTDWINYSNNWRAWRSRTSTNAPYQDSKWRYMLYDNDFGLGLYEDGNNYNSNTIDFLYNSIEEYAPDSEYFPTTLLFNLLENEDFKQRFVTSFMDISNVNFNPTTSTDKLYSYFNEYSKYVNDCFSRFGPQWVNIYYPNSVDYLLKETRSIEKFLKNRYMYVPTMLKDSLDLSGEAVKLTLSISDADAGDINVNTTTPNLSTGKWSGYYFTDYPITLKATAKEGYSFVGWEGLSESTSSEITVNLSESANIKAIFVKK